jgi:hypothetical protein
MTNFDFTDRVEAHNDRLEISFQFKQVEVQHLSHYKFFYVW